VVLAEDDVDLEASGAISTCIEHEMECARRFRWLILLLLLPPTPAPPTRPGDGDDLGGDAKFRAAALPLLRKILGGFRGWRRNGDCEKPADDADGEAAKPKPPPPPAPGKLEVRAAAPPGRDDSEEAAEAATAPAPCPAAACIVEGEDIVMKEEETSSLGCCIRGGRGRCLCGCFWMTMTLTGGWKSVAAGEEGSPSGCPIR
jgi:hypothetical protein